MPKFRVHLSAVASCTVEVEAENGDEACEKAFNEKLPYAGWNDGFELTEWQTLSELFPEHNKPEDDYEEIES